jgi:hypothetical protein
MAKGAYRVSIVKAFFKGEKILRFECALQEDRTIKEGQVVPIRRDNFDKSLESVTQTVFHFDTLENSYLWITRRMFKSSKKTTRHMTASTTCFNSALPFSIRNRFIQVH